MRSATRWRIGGAELEALLDSMNSEQLKKITWLDKPPEVARGRCAPDTTSVAVAVDKITLCKLLGVGASRCVYDLEARYALKYEYGDPIGRGSNTWRLTSHGFFR